LAALEIVVFAVVHVAGFRVGLAANVPSKDWRKSNFFKSAGAVSKGEQCLRALVLCTAHSMVANPPP